MDFAYTEKEEAFRQEIRDWLAKHAKELPKWWFDRKLKRPDQDSKEMHEFGVWWHKKLYDGGFVGLTGPRSTAAEALRFLSRWFSPRKWQKPGYLVLPIPSASAGADPRYRFRHRGAEKALPTAMLRAEEIWCQGFSEPEAGSDLANCQTKGVQDGDYWVVNGQKVWTSGGHYSDWAILIVRTEPTAPKHRGLSFFLLDMHAPGVTVRPLRQMTGGAEFNETFMDNVRIHKSMQVGERGRGFYVAMGTLEFERSGIGAAIGRENTIEEMVVLAKNGQEQRPACTSENRAIFYRGQRH